MVCELSSMTPCLYLYLLFGNRMKLKYLFIMDLNRFDFEIIKTELKDEIREENEETLTSFPAPLMKFEVTSTFGTLIPITIHYEEGNKCLDKQLKTTKKKCSKIDITKDPITKTNTEEIEFTDYSDNTVKEKEKKLECGYCGYSTAYTSTLKNHIASKHLQLKSRKCHLCQFSTTQISSLRYHINSFHMKIKRYRCDLCDYTHYRQCGVKKHHDRVHLKLRNHHCHLCNSSFMERYLVKKHIQQVHLKIKKNKSDV
ncbi:hypothetical protein HHI36_021009 [Cryptolaemus montrouzieri]|uniref:C2H2-type domain-containing protein n=1 Tax=Cryptolaemus montrouzieri TaxID=559131 RepID=A0ABD2MWH0_9CUCU